MHISKAEGCAWRARYVYLDKPIRLPWWPKYRHDTKIFSVGIDPNNGVKPTLFGSILFESFRIPLPRIKWRSGLRRDGSSAWWWQLWLPLYKLSQWFWHKMDGRYGWGTSHAKR